MGGGILSNLLGTTPPYPTCSLLMIYYSLQKLHYEPDIFDRCNLRPKDKPPQIHHSLLFGVDKALASRISAISKMHVITKLKKYLGVLSIMGRVHFGLFHPTGRAALLACDSAQPSTVTGRAGMVQKELIMLGQGCPACV